MMFLLVWNPVDPVDPDWQMNGKLNKALIFFGDAKVFATNSPIKATFDSLKQRCENVPLENAPLGTHWGIYQQIGRKIVLTKIVVMFSFKYQAVSSGI